MASEIQPPRIARWLLPLALTQISCSQEVVEPPTASAARPNILLVTVDSLQKEHLQTYGHEDANSPELLRFSEDALVFEDAQANTVLGQPFYASLMTGQSTAGHACRTAGSRLADSNSTLAEGLLSAGYDTAAIVTSDSLGRGYGLAQGIVHLDDELALPAVMSGKASTSDEVSERALEFLGAKAEATGAGKDQPWFLWLHYADPSPDHLYHKVSADSATQVPPPKGVKEADVRASEIRFTDFHLGRVLSAVDSLGFKEETLVVVLGAQGNTGLPIGASVPQPDLSSDQTALPLMIRGPGGESGRIEPMVRTLDLAPTLLDFAGRSPSNSIDGLSLRGLIDGAGNWSEPACLLEWNPNPLVDVVGVVTPDQQLLMDLSTGKSQVVERDTRADPDSQNSNSESLEQLKLRVATLQLASRKNARRNSDSSDTQGNASGAKPMEGLVRFNYPSGELWARGSLKAGRRTGMWETWYPNGKRKSAEKFADGVLIGMSLAWHASGEMYFRGGFKDGLPHGKWNYWYDGMLRRAELRFKNGASTGKWGYWNEKKKQMVALEFEDQGRRVLVREQHTNGRKRSKGYFQDGLRVGAWRTWHRGGGLMRYWVYESGRLHGESFAYNPAGFEIEELSGAYFEGAALPSSD